MGWSGGSEVARPIIKAVKKHVSDLKAREEIYKVILETLTNQDWDTLEESEGIDPLFDKVIEKYLNQS